eukprot:TRINITY_DN30_c1_g7_i1.p1 TRINITY_DN30_c1_g7~~TRINITY_DN30_c1_g7_i1.p1  ORF type:complete len:278 (-),score=98.09 TRINITY_DN30_c1_g7_i1:231-1064(-)
MGNVHASEDTKEYLQHYPNDRNPDDKKLNQNLRFYSNEMSSKPRGAKIDNMHKTWYGDYHKLEAHHGFIQWIFPIREQGLNGSAHKLQLHEIEAISNSDEMKERLVKSYEMMLDFYGMVLQNRETGEVRRNKKNYKSRYNNLNHSFHNYLRITRILKCLGELGFEHYKKPFCIHVVREMYENKKLTNAKRSCLNYWIPVLRNEEEREELRDIIEDYEDNGGKNNKKRFKKSKKIPTKVDDEEENNEEEQNNNNNNDSNDKIDDDEQDEDEEQPESDD